MLGNNQIDLEKWFLMIDFLLNSGWYLQSYGFWSFLVAQKGTKRSQMALKVLFSGAV